MKEGKGRLDADNEGRGNIFAWTEKGQRADDLLQKRPWVSMVESEM